MKKQVLKIGFGKLSVAGKGQKAKQILSLMTGNASFPNPNPSLLQLQGSISNLEKPLPWRSMAEKPSLLPCT